MENLAGVHRDYCDEQIREELYLAGIEPVEVERSTGEVRYSYIGKVGNWTFTRLWYYWSARVEKTEDGLLLEKAMELNNMKHPLKDMTMESIIRAGGHGGGISPDDYVSNPVYNDELTEKLVALGYEKKYHEHLKEYYVNINRGEISTLNKEGKLNVPFYVDSYHIDNQIGLNVFVKFIKENQK